MAMMTAMETFDGEVAIEWTQRLGMASLEQPSPWCILSSLKN